MRIAAGSNASFAVTDSCLLLSWGNRDYTGHDDIEEHFLEPRQLTALRGTVADVAASFNHVMVVGSGGQLWTFGNNEQGQLGSRSLHNKRTPHLVTSFPPGERVVQAAAGYGHSLALTRSGAVYSWGGAEYGELGHGDYEHQLLPRRIEALAGERVVRVDANRWGEGISAVTTSERAVLMFGRGRHGSLGLEDEEGRNLPTRVAALAAGMAMADMGLGGDPDEEESWSVVMMGSGGIVGERLYRWGHLCVTNGVDPRVEEVPSEGSPVAAWPL